MKKVLNVLGIICSIPLSLLLMLMLTITPTISALSSLVTPETVKEIIKEVGKSLLMSSDESTELTYLANSSMTVSDVNTDSILNSPEVSEILNSYGITPEIAQEILQMPAVEEILDLYIDDIFTTIIDGPDAELKLDAEALKEIINNNMDDIVPVVKDIIEANSDPGFTITEEEIRQEITTIIEENAEEIITYFPTPEDLGIVPPTNNSEDTNYGDGNIDVNNDMQPILETIQLFNSGAILAVVIIISAILSILIFLLRFKRFEGFIWLGVVYILSAMESLSLSFGLKGLDLSTVTELPANATDLITPILHIMSDKMLIGSLIILALGVVFIAAFVLIKRFTKKVVE